LREVKDLPYACNILFDMPLKILPTPFQGALMGLWHIQESMDDLTGELHELKRPDLLKNPLFKADKRNFEWLATRVALTKLTGTQAGIKYDDKGKPHLTHQKGHLSISHSWPYVCLFYHERLSVGVDIEHLDPKILRIRHKFVNETEALWLKETEEIKGLYLIWAAKESVFKMIGGGGILFKEHMLLNPLTISSKGSATISYLKEAKKETFIIYYEFLEGMILVYTIANDPKAS
jgi:4'-phosphopantetheinyl transferase